MNERDELHPQPSRRHRRSGEGRGWEDPYDVPRQQEQWYGPGPHQSPVDWQNPTAPGGYDYRDRWDENRIDQSSGSYAHERVGDRPTEDAVARSGGRQGARPDAARYGGHHPRLEEARAYRSSGDGARRYGDDFGTGYRSFTDSYGGRDFTGDRPYSNYPGTYGTTRSGGYGSGYGYEEGRGYGGAEHSRHERGFLQRAGDEVASWFGDEEAARRREMDHRGRGPANYTRSDERILEDACDRLTDDWAVDARQINVQVENGEITLNGTVESRLAKRRAEDLVDHVTGVRHVQNNLRVQDTTAEQQGGAAERR